MSKIRFVIAILLLFSPFIFASIDYGNDSPIGPIDDKPPEEMSQEILSEAEQKAEDVETIEIAGRKTYSYFRRQVEIAELDFYELYNSLVDESKYRMICRREMETGSRIKRMRCYPQYFLDAYSHASQEALSNTSTQLLKRGIVRNVPGMKIIEFITKREQDASLEYVENIVKENPGLYKKLIKMNQAVIELEKFKQKNK